MVKWDQKFRKKLAELVGNVLLYKRYIDDQNVVMEAVGPGVRYNKEEQRLEQVENDTEVDEVPSDKRTFEIVREVGDSVDPMIQLTVDYPSNHPINRVPILDLGSLDREKTIVAKR